MSSTYLSPHITTENKAIQQVHGRKKESESGGGRGREGREGREAMVDTDGKRRSE